MPRLVFYRIGDEPPMELSRANLTAAPFTCGSGVRNDLPVPDRAVPVQQLGILRIGRGWRLKNLSR